MKTKTQAPASMTLRPYNPEPTAKMFHARDEVFRGVMGPIGSGKSVICALECFSRALEQKPNASGVRSTRWAFIRNSYPELLSTTAKTWAEWVPESICPLSVGVNVAARLVQRLADDTWVDMEIFFLALERDDDIRKLKSLELTGAWLNEAGELRKSVLDMAMGRVGRYPARIDGGATWSGVVADTNPVSDDHWWYRLAEKEQPRGYLFFKQPPAVVPAPSEDAHFPPEYVGNDGSFGYARAENVSNHSLGFSYWLRQVPGKDLEWIKVFLMGQYGTVTTDKAVYAEYNDAIHCAAKPFDAYRGLPLLIGWDFGLNASCVIVQLSPQGQLIVLDELTSEDMGVQRFARERVRPLLNNKYGGMGYTSVGDPAGGQRSQTTETTCLQILAEEGFPCVSAPTNEFVARREAVAWFLSRMVGGLPALLLSPACENLRKGFLGKYFYRRVHISKTDRFLERPEKNEYSHVQDALQYACLMCRVGFAREDPLRRLGTVTLRNAKKSKLEGWT